MCLSHLQFSALKGVPSPSGGLKNLAEHFRSVATAGFPHLLSPFTSDSGLHCEDQTPKPVPWARVIEKGIKDRKHKRKYYFFGVFLPEG